MSYVIRSFQMDDLPFLWEMLYESIYVPIGSERPSKSILEEADIRKYLVEWGRESDSALIATTIQGTRVGAIWIRQFTMNQHGYGFVDERVPEVGMAVVDGHRGEGLGRKLLSAMCNLAKTRDFPGLSLSVDPRNEAAVHLYETSGFVKQSEDSGGSWTMVRWS